MTGFATKPLSTFVKLASGGTPSKGNPEYWGGDIPWLTPKDMSRFDETTQNAVTEKAIGNGTKRAPIGSLFIAVRGMSLHKEIRIVRPDRQMTFNQDIKAITPTNAIGPQFLFYAMLARIPDLLGAVESAGHGTGVLPTDKLNALPIPELPLPEQRAIAATLGVLDDKIELNRRMNETLEGLARALFRDWFVDFGPTRAKMAQSATESATEGATESGIGAKPQNALPAPYLSPALWSLFPDRLDDAGKPEGWEFEAVIDQADWINGAAYKNMHFSDAPDALPVIKIAELKNGVTGNTAWTATDLGSRYQIDDGELLFSWSGNPDTSIDTFLWSGGKAWLNQHIFAVRETGKRSKPFLHAMLKFLKPNFAEIARNKQTTGLGHVTKADMRRMLICTAPESVHQAFDKLITPIFDRAFLLQIESRTLAQTRDLLLPRLMSGELRVAEAARAVEEVL